MKRYLKIALFVIVLAVIVNDGGRWGQAVIDLHNSTGSVLDQAALDVRKMPVDQLANEMAQRAASQGIIVTQYQTTATGIHVWTEEDVAGTWIIGPYFALAKGVPFTKALKTPFTVRYDAEEAAR